MSINSEQLMKICNDYPELKIAFNLKIWETDFLRFYRSQTNYNISKSNENIDVSLFKGKKAYSFSITNPDVEKLKSKIDEALTFIDELPEDPDFVDLEATKSELAFDEKTNNIERFPLEEKVEILNEIAQELLPLDFKIFGTFITNNEYNYIVNSNGINVVQHNSPIMLEMKAVSSKNEVTVLESFGSENKDLFNLQEFKNSLITKVKIATKQIVDVNPDEYEVILAPRCIAEFVSYLGWVGFSAYSLDRKGSFFENKVDEKLFPENVSIYDDPTNSNLIRNQYNSDGFPIEKLDLIKNGVFKNFFVENYMSHKLGMKNNGGSGDNLVIEKGDQKLDDMIKSVKKGLYVSSLHYMNFINGKETSITGLTRDGTFLIEDGKMTKVVNNLRFTEKITRVLEHIIEIEDKQYTVPFSGNYGSFSIQSSLAPHVKLSKFKITSSTETI